MKLRALRAHYLDGRIVEVGATYEADDTLGRQLIAAGKSVPAAEKGDKKPAAKPGPMTTRTAGALVPGAATAKEPDHVLSGK